MWVQLTSNGIPEYANNLEYVNEPEHVMSIKTEYVKEPEMYIARCLATRSGVSFNPQFLVVHLSAILYH
jgi:hypothetical protein